MANSQFIFWGSGQVIIGPISIQGNVNPSADNTYDLGTSLQWRTAYLGTSAQLATGATVQWSTDLTLKRIAAGQLGLQKDSTHGVTLDVATDTFAKFLNRDGTTDGVTLSANIGKFSTGMTVNAGSFMNFNGHGLMRSPSDGVFSLSNDAENKGFRIDGNTTSGVAAFLALAGADTATVKANKAQITGLGAFASGDKYVIVDASGNFHVSALGPAS